LPPLDQVLLPLGRFSVGLERRDFAGPFLVFGRLLARLDPVDFPIFPRETRLRAGAEPLGVRAALLRLGLGLGRLARSRWISRVSRMGTATRKLSGPSACTCAVAAPRPIPVSMITKPASRAKRWTLPMVSSVETSVCAFPAGMRT
jgi:hypothetical protein